MINPVSSVRRVSMDALASFTKSSLHKCERISRLLPESARYYVSWLAGAEAPALAQVGLLSSTKFLLLALIFADRSLDPTR
jgi:hypothetical protein